ncbi:Uncharacterised protein [Mycobacteroides abscessus subsp. abscessus]|nr:Uncharacterised protein [Mycobacteroides abscessus subsp. abscessus]SID30260.1 Uncharacterised protein [Mycobacteroides abscessus subsp. abscessus]SKQ48857.1 Uncharacterised protein [Mycobacteroides abscessus subsp. abscessus]
MRNRPDSGSILRLAAPQAHGAAGSNNAAAAVTISGLGNRNPNASIARSSPVAVPSSTESRTFSAHITSPPAAAGLRLGASVDVRPTTVALAPCGLAASGARDLRSTEAPAEPCPNGGCSATDVEPSVDGVETVIDDAMLGIGVPAPQSLGAAHRASGSAKPLDGSASTVSGLCPFVGQPEYVSAVQCGAYDAQNQINRRSVAISSA